ncbi:MAG: AI-2E family transporter [Acidimicrobiales bacterium]
MISQDDPTTTVPQALINIGDWGWRFLAGTAATLVLAYIVIQLSVIVIPVLMAMFLASILEPMAAWLRAHGWHRSLAATTIFTLNLVVLVCLLAWIGTSVAGQFDQVGDQAKEGADEIRGWVQDQFNVSPERLESFQDQASSALRQTGGGGISRQVIGGARFALEFVGGLVLTLFTLFFLLKDGDRMAAWLDERASPRYRDDLQAAGKAGREIMKQYLFATAATGFIDAVLIGVALWVMGVPLVLPLAVLTFLGGFLPIIGATVAGLIATLIALVSGGVGDAAVILGATIAVQQIEGNLLQPLILGPALRLHALVTVLAVAGGLAVGGILGAFLSVPLIAFAVQMGHFYRSRTTTELAG